MDYEPTQRDRDAAASGYFAWCSGNRVIPSKMQSGRADDHSMVQSFARHAAAERAIGYRMGIEAARRQIRGYADGCFANGNEEGDAICGDLDGILRALPDNAEGAEQ